MMFHHQSVDCLQMRVWMPHLYFVNILAISFRLRESKKTGISYDNLAGAKVNKTRQLSDDFPNADKVITLKNEDFSCAPKSFLSS